MKACMVLMLIAGMGLATLPSRAATGVDVRLLPADTSIVALRQIDIVLSVPAAGSGFNGFSAVVGYDSTFLEFQQASPVSLQEGSLMGQACGETFHSFAVKHDSLRITEILLCDRMTVTGPGTLYRLHFKGKTRLGVTQVFIRPGMQFFDAGSYVVPVTASVATVRIISAADVAGTGPAAPRPRLLASPNPFRGVTVLSLEFAPRGAAYSLEIRDLQGRHVRSAPPVAAGGEGATFHWDGRDDLGRPAPAGLYWARIDGLRPGPVARVLLIR